MPARNLSTAMRRKARKFKITKTVRPIKKIGERVKVVPSKSSFIGVVFAVFLGHFD